jgi:hypothetical protein
LHAPFGRFTRRDAFSWLSTAALPFEYVVLGEVPVMAGPGYHMPAGAEGWGRLRASHADRERVVGVLKAAFVEGRLAKDEFDERVGQAFAARTYAELAAVTADLPAVPTPATARRAARAPGGRAAVRPGRVITAASVLYAGAWATMLLSPLGENPLARALIPNGTMVYLGVLMICIAAIFVSRRDSRSGQEPPRRPGAGGPASRYRPPAAADAQLPPADPGHRHTAEAARLNLPRPPSPVRGRFAGGPFAAGAAPASG